MAEARKRIRVTNNTAHDIVLPPVNGKKAGTGRDWPELRVLPGGYNVDAEYLEAIRGPKATPGARKAYLQLTTVQPRQERADLVVSEDPKALKAKEGVKPPPSLAAYGEDKAVMIVKHTDDVDALKIWVRAENRPDVKAAIEDRLSELG